jgi:outer membrane receptor protein involved in Fe transport
MSANHADRNSPGPSSQALTAAVSTVLSVASGTATAQEQPAQAPTGLSEVIVTATKRAERLQDVSESISAFDSSAIAMRGLQQISDISKYIPGLSLAQREPGGTTIVFRGVAASGLAFGGVSSSALYLDEQPITQSGRNPSPRFIDIERVEALRGPQGTLYGASSQSGTLRVITSKPDPTAFDAWGEAQINNIHGGGTGYDVSAMVNVPLGSDKVALRVVGFSTEDAGYIDNVLSTSPLGQLFPGEGTFDNSNVVKDNVNSIDTNGGRAALKWDLTDGVDVTLGLIYQDTKAHGHSDVTPGTGDLNQVRFEKENLSDRWYQAALTLNASMGFGDLVVAASYFDRKFAYEADATDYEFSFDRASYYYNSSFYDFGIEPRGFATNHEVTHITTVEARLQSNHDAESRWSWLGGLFYSRESGHTQFDSFVRDYQDTPAFAYFNYYEQNLTGNALAPTEEWFLGIYDTELEQRAVFGEVGFDFTDKFTVTAGGRWFEYDRVFDLHQEAPVGFSGATLTDAATKSDESGSVYKLNFTYRLDDDRLLYATYSEGFRVGGANPVRPISILPHDFKSDDLANYEIGAKTEWLENRIRFNIAAYLMKWKDFAVQIEDPQEEVFQLGYVNLPTAEIPGVETEFTFAINDAWQVDATLGWNDAHVSEPTVLTLTNDAGDVFEIPVTDGARLPLTPDWTASLGIEWRSRGRIMDSQPFARLDVAYAGESVNNLEGLESVVSRNGVTTQDSYETGDFRVGLEGEHWSTSLFVSNVWDERAVTYTSNRWARQRLTILQPRTDGLQFRYSF